MRGIQREASEVHHIIKSDVDPDLAYTDTNLVSLCHECHMNRHSPNSESAKKAKKTRKEFGRFSGGYYE